MAKEVNLNIDEVKDFVKHIVENNRYLQAQGKPSVAVEVMGDSGIGKTSAILQIADELSFNCVKINLAQIEELGDLVGFPIRQFEVCKDGECMWADEHAVEDYTRRGYQFTGLKRMSYCPPEWIADKTEGGILILDDWNRADVRFIQAVMELIDRQQYISWKLPQDWHIILTSNPDNGDYLVNSTDNAQRTRYITANLKFDIKVWARWAEANKLDTRCINFLLMHPELVTTQTNARSITTFFNAISSIPVFEDKLNLIQNIGEGSVGSEFASLFTLFINNKLDKLITPQDMLTKDEKYVKGVLNGVIGENNSYRADIASTLATRLVNFSLNYATTNSIPDPMISRISMLVTDEIFGTDLNYYVIRTILNGNKSKFSKLMMDPKVIQMSVK
jgi:hypothetical protein